MANKKVIEWIDLNYGRKITEPGSYRGENVEGVVMVRQQHIDKVEQDGESYQVVIGEVTDAAANERQWQILSFE